MNEYLKEIIALLGGMGGVFVACVKFVNSRLDHRFGLVNGVLDKQDEDIRAEVAERHALDLRLQAIETRVAHMPTNEDVRQVHDQLASMGAKLAVVGERSTATAAGVRRIEEFLLTNKGNS
jgi:hypothetical protein